MISEVCLLYICMPKVQWEDHCSKKNFTYGNKIRNPLATKLEIFFMRLVM